MSQINWLDVFNSSIVFGLLAIIALGIWLSLIKKDIQSKPSKRR